MKSTVARPTLRVLKKLKRKWCLSNYISKWLDFQVFLDKDYSINQGFRLATLVLKTHTIQREKGTEFPVL